MSIEERLVELEKDISFLMDIQNTVSQRVNRLLEQNERILEQNERLVDDLQAEYNRQMEKT